MRRRRSLRRQRCSDPLQLLRPRQTRFVPRLPTLRARRELQLDRDRSQDPKACHPGPDNHVLVRRSVCDLRQRRVSSARVPKANGPAVRRLVSRNGRERLARVGPVHLVRAVPVVHGPAVPVWARSRKQNRANLSTLANHPQRLDARVR